MVGGRNPQGPVGGLYDIPHAADFSVEEPLPIHDLAAVIQLQAPEPLSAEGSHEEVAFPLGYGPFDHDLRPARGGPRGQADVDGVALGGERLAPALDRGPAVVLPGFDPIDL